jgi:ferredoxin
MPVLRVGTVDGEQEIPFTQGASVREILAAGGLSVRSGCGGMGACGLCLVRIEAGAVNDRTEQELSRLWPEELRAGVRFACQVKPLEEIRVTIVNPPPHSSWRSLSRDDLTHYLPQHEARGAIGEALGICGSGLVDVIATLLRSGILNVTGRLIGDMGNDGLVILKQKEELRLMNRDIEM